VTDRAAEDLTARARIRDAALHLFAERGIEGATVRDIAKAAGVSSGLVRHHFGSKEALRDVCDSYAMERITRLREELLLEGRLTDHAALLSLHPTVIVLQSYLVRSMLDGSARASAMFDEAVRQAEEWLVRQGAQTRDLRAYAAVLVAMQTGVFMLRDQLSRAIGDDVRAPVGHARMTRGFVDAFTHPLLTPDQAAKAHEMLDQLQTGKQRAKE
jgi:AcrR family transcriptional regulator